MSPFQCVSLLLQVGDPVAYARHASSLVQLLVAAYSVRVLCLQPPACQTCRTDCLTPLAPCLTTSQEREIVILLNDLVKKLQQSSIASAAAEGGTQVARASAPPAALPHLEVLLMSLVEGEVQKAKAEAAAAAADGSDPAAPAPSRFSGVITSESFSKLLDMFTGERKPPLTRALLAAICSMPGTITDPVVVNT